MLGSAERKIESVVGTKLFEREGGDAYEERRKETL